MRLGILLCGCAFPVLVGCAGVPRKAAPVERAEWASLVPLPAPRFLGPQVAFAGGKLIAMGGLVKDGERYYASDRVDVYDPRRGTWTQGAAMPAPWSDFAVAVVGTRVFATGGGGQRRTELLEYDVAADRWASRAPMQFERVHHAAAAVGGAIYVLGGRSSPEKLERYDVAAGRWTRLPDLPRPKENPYAVALGGRIYVLGGRDSSGEGEYARFDVFEPETGAWRELASLPTRRTDVALATARGRIYVMGGWQKGGLSTAVDVYDPVLDRWSPAAALPRALSFAGAGSAGRTLYLVGGAQYVGERLTPFASLLVRRVD